MKNIIFFALACLVISSCSNMKADADKACNYTTQLIEMMPEMMQLSMKATLESTDLHSMDEAQKELNQLQADLDKMAEELKTISEKYDKEEWEAYVLENCEVKKFVRNG